MRRKVVCIICGKEKDGIPVKIDSIIKAIRWIKTNITRKFSYVRTYRVVRKVNDQSNAISRFVQGLIDKYVLKSDKGA